MEYLVMECGLSYAVVLDGEGRFLKVPNLGYEVGQTLDRVIVQDAPSGHQTHRWRFTRWAAMAACLCLVLLGGWGFWQSPVGTVRMQINPDVQMSVNRFDRVVGLNGLNDDGEALIGAYRSYGKDLGIVSDELADRAVDMGFLRDGGQIALTVESDRANWKTATEEMLLLELEVHLEHRVAVVIAPANASDQPGDPPETIVIEPDKLLPAQPGDDNAPQEDGASGNERDDDAQDDNDNDDDLDNSGDTAHAAPDDDDFDGDGSSDDDHDDMDNDDDRDDDDNDDNDDDDDDQENDDDDDDDDQDDD